MRKKVTALSALAAGIVLATGGTAAADDPINVKGGKDFSTGPHIMKDSPGLININGNLIYAPCAVPWHNGAVLAATIPANSRYSACAADKVDQSHDGTYLGGIVS
ncbi:hypothetical protein [Streptomyces coerulescens]|uniref:Secreted protein n=1 Tax=Streptomyces coerulescens TaxID=29304 RepID=A0ABW0CPN0_STRCD